MKLENAIKQIKRTEAGKVLFGYLNERYIKTQIHCKDPIEMAKKAAQYDLVLDLLLTGDNQNEQMEKCGTSTDDVR